MPETTSAYDFLPGIFLLKSIANANLKIPKSWFETLICVQQRRINDYNGILTLCNCLIGSYYFYDKTGVKRINY